MLLLLHADPYVVSQSTGILLALCRAKFQQLVKIWAWSSYLGKVCGSPQSQRSLPIRPHFLRQALQVPWSMRNRFSRNRRWRGSRNPCCRIARFSAKVELNTLSDRKSSLRRAMLSIGAMSSHSGCLDFIVIVVGGKSSLSVIPIVSAFASDFFMMALQRRSAGSIFENKESHGRAGTNSSCNESHGRVQLRVNAVGMRGSGPHRGTVLGNWVAKGLKLKCAAYFLFHPK